MVVVFIILNRIFVLMKQSHNGSLLACLIVSVPAGNHGSCIPHLEQDICFHEYKYHDSLQARLI